MSRNPVTIDLFAGAGGLGEGLASAGARVAAAVELHPQAALTYAFNHPTTRVLVGDIRQLAMSRLEEAVSSAVDSDDRVDIVAGGPPCQGFSTAGKKMSEDPRNSLFHHFVRVVEHFRPRVFLLENVPGFKTMHGGRAYAGAVSMLSGLGYSLCDALIQASDYGVPQGRLRFIMVGRLDSETASFEWPEATHGATAQPTLFSSLKAPVTVLDALEDIAFLEPGFEAHRHAVDPSADYQRDRRAGCSLLFNHLASRHRERAVAMFSHIKEGGTISSVPAELRSAKRTMARMDRTTVSNAVLALPDDLIHYRHARIPTVREMARLQSFDDDFVIIGKRTSGFVERRVDVPQYTQVGNAVPPLLGRALGTALMRTLGAPTCDLREVAERRRRHSWVLGSSGFAGYVLSPLAETKIALTTVTGEAIELPTSDVLTPVEDSTALQDWTIARNPKRGQWSPGVQARPAPAHVGIEESECEG